jgi:hypothetical protein
VRKIVRQPLKDKIWNRWRKACEKAKIICLDNVSHGKKPSINEYLYKWKSIKINYFFSKEAPFYGKCAYCETYIPDYFHGDIDHFRPKAGVTDENDKPIVLKNNQGENLIDDYGQPKFHPGYYWLAYDWCNLLPSCSVCNQPAKIGDKKIGKHNRFPVDGQHAQCEDEINNEMPLLINPLSDNEDDDPDKHLTIDTSTGILGYKTERGKACIEIFGLNLRDQLVDDRLKTCGYVRGLLVMLIYSNPNNNEQIKKEINEFKFGKKSHTIASNAIFYEIVNYIDDIF